MAVLAHSGAVPVLYSTRWSRKDLSHERTNPGRGGDSHTPGAAAAAGAVVSAGKAFASATANR
jgi:hypothetical protein